MGDTIQQWLGAGSVERRSSRLTFAPSTSKCPTIERTVLARPGAQKVRCPSK